VEVRAGQTLAGYDLELLKDAMAACENCKYGLWTNGLEFFFFQVKRTKFDVKFVPISFPAIGTAVRTGKVSMGTFVEPFYSAEMAKGGLRPLFTAAETLGYDHELLDLWFGEKFMKAQPDVVRAFLADYIAATKHYLANKEAGKRDIHKAGFVRTPVEIYVKNLDWKRDPNGQVDVPSLKKLATFMLEKLNWLEKPVNVDEMVDLSFLPR
jgi:ABC-type nitrate/sulfonate/bicarbonate transport system substrate-binding protein